MGYTETAVTISERAGLFQLHVSISVPDTSVTIDNSVFFHLLVNTSDTTATSWCMFTIQSCDMYCAPATLTLSLSDQARFGNLVIVVPDLATTYISQSWMMTVNAQLYYFVVNYY